MSKKLRILFTCVLTVALLLTSALAVSAGRRPGSPFFPIGSIHPVVAQPAPADSPALIAILESTSAKSLSLFGKTYPGMGDFSVNAAHIVSGGSLAGGTMSINAPAAFYGVTISADIVVNASAPVLFQGCTITGAITANTPVYFDNVRWNGEFYYVVGSYTGGCLNNTAVCPYNWTVGFIGGNTSCLYPYGCAIYWDGTTLIPVSGYTYYMPYARLGNIYIVSTAIYCPGGCLNPTAPVAPGVPVVPQQTVTTSAATILANCKSSAKINAAVSSNWSLSNSTLTAKSFNAKKLNRVAIPAATARDMAASGIQTLAFSTPNGIVYSPADSIRTAINSCNVNLAGYVFEIDIIRVNEKAILSAYDFLGGRALAAPTKVILRLYNPTTGAIHTLNPVGTLLAQATGLTTATSTLASAMYNGTQFVYTGDQVSFRNGTVYMPVVSGRVLVPVK